MASPPALSTNPLRRITYELRAERDASVPLPPGELRFSMARTQAFQRNPLPLLLEAYHRHGPVFTLRLLHAPNVFALGPEANHHMTVSHAQNFRWRDGGLGDLAPLLGDGLLTIDGEHHRRARRAILPAFHRERVAAAAETMVGEAERAVAPWRPGERVDVYHWARALALRIAMRALFGLDPDRAAGGVDTAAEFERALAFYSRAYLLQTLRGPRTPWARMAEARRRLDAVLYREIAARRADPSRSGEDVLSLLLEARDEDGRAFGDREVRDHVMTLLFAGHDTSTSTISFLLYELARAPAAAEALRAEQDRVLGGRAPRARELDGELPELEMAVDETLRLYPPAWIGPRRAVADFELAGVPVPGGVAVNYCSWASHRLPDVFEDPDAFRPERFAPEARAALPKGAYVPFGGGSRTCIGMRFGLTEVRAVATVVLQRFRLELEPGYELSIRQMPTLSPRGGLPMRVVARD